MRRLLRRTAVVRLPDPQERGGLVAYLEAIVCVSLVALIGFYFSGQDSIPKWAVLPALFFAYRFGNLANELQNPDRLPNEDKENLGER